MVTKGEKSIPSTAIPGRIVLYYVIAGGLWILFSDRLLTLMVRDTAAVLLLQTFKGWAFVAVTALLLYLLLQRNITRLHKTEDALLAAEARYRTLVEQVLVGIYIIREGRFVYVNPKFEEIFGYSRDEILSLPSVVELVAEQDRALVAENVRRRLRGEVQSIRYTFKGRRKDGTLIDIEAHGSVMDAQGGVAIVGVLLDVTEQRKAEAALRESEERIRVLVESAEDIIIMQGLDGRYLYYNASPRYGLKADDVIGKTPYDLFDTGAADKIMRQIEKVKETGAGLSDERSVPWQGQTVWFLDQISPIRDAAGAIVAVARISRNITERKLAEVALEENEERYRVIAQTASDAIITVDEESRVVFANEAVREVFGIEPDVLTGEMLTVIIPPRFRDGHMNGMKRYLASGIRKAGWHAKERPGIRSDGREIPLEVSYGEFTTQGKRFFTGVIRDITERKLAEKEKEYKNMLERFSQELQALVAERTIGLLALRLADRVRNPAAVIGWTAARLLRKGDVPEAGREGLATVAEEAEKLEGIVKDFQALLQRKEPVYTYGDLNAVVRSVLAIIEKEAAPRHVHVEARLSEQPLMMNMQTETLRTAVFIMFRNGVESSVEGGSVTVTTHEKDGEIVLAVSDNGRGIPGKLVEKIFDPFYGAQIERYGLGWPLVKQIASEHLGRVEMQSERGAGTTCVAFFPKRWARSGTGQ
jgi:PAS domain S-box-containing protein